MLYHHRMKILIINDPELYSDDMIDAIRLMLNSGIALQPKYPASTTENHSLRELTPRQ